MPQNCERRYDIHTLEVYCVEVEAVDISVVELPSASKEAQSAC